MSSSSSSQRSSTPWSSSSTARRCSAVAADKRGNHARGTPSSRPSTRTRCIVVSENETVTARGGSASKSRRRGEVPMPCLQEKGSVLDYDLSCPRQLAGSKPSCPGKRDRSKPELSLAIALSHVHVGRFVAFVAEEVEAEAIDPQNRGHRIRIPTMESPGKEQIWLGSGGASRSISGAASEPANGAASRLLLLRRPTDRDHRASRRCRCRLAHGRDLRRNAVELGGRVGHGRRDDTVSAV